jgi:threonine synthase
MAPDHSTASDRPPAEAPLVDLLDGASGNSEPLPPEMERDGRIAADPARPLAERLEAYEDLTESEVGDTSLTRARNLERQFGLRQLFLKFEGGNPTGTQKDRIAFAQAMDAVRRGFEAITVATCGNYGAAVALAARLAGLRCLIYVPATYHTRRVAEMEEQGAEILRADGDYEAAVAASRQRAARDEVYDANPGGDNLLLQLKAYGEIAYEIYDELRDAPAVVAVPVSNGTTLAGIHRGFVSLYRRGKTSHLPHLVGGSASGKNPVVRAFRKGLERCEDLPPESIRETVVNEPLINWHSIDGDAALAAIRGTGGWAGNASDRTMLRLARQLREQEGLLVLPASTAGLAALLERHRERPLAGERYVAVLTGRKG